MSQRWKDSKGREWVARLEVGVADELRAGGLDLLNPEQLGAAMGDALQVVRLIAAAHRSQYQAQNMSEGDFVELATETAEVADAAAAALEAALADFFRRLRRPALAGVVATASKAARAGENLAVEKLSDPRIEQAMAASMARASAELDDVLEAAITGRKSGS